MIIFITLPIRLMETTAMKSVCDKYGALFILDEVSASIYLIAPINNEVTCQIMSGMGRE